MVLAAFRGWTPQIVVDTIASFSFLTHFTRLTQGVVDLPTAVFFVSLIVICLIVNTLVTDLTKAA
jgi:ABC-2 type transport system permease protein